MADKLSLTGIETASEYIEQRPSHWEDPSKYFLIMPAILVVLFLSIFPLLLSIFTSLSRIEFVKGGFQVDWVGLDNYRKLLMNPLSQERARSEHRHFMGKMVPNSDISTVGWIILALFIVVMLCWLARFLFESHPRPRWVFGRLLYYVPGMGAGWLAARQIVHVVGLPDVLGWAVLVGLLAALLFWLAREVIPSVGDMARFLRARPVGGFLVRIAVALAGVVALRMLTNTLAATDPSAQLARFFTQRTILDILWLIGLFLAYFWVARYLTDTNRKAVGVALRTLTVLIATTLVWITIRVSSADGLPGTLVVTLTLVFGGVTLQYTLGLGLALLVTQNLPGRRFFRVIFLLPMMITPVGIGFLFRMLMDTIIGPLAPVWSAAGLASFSWVDDPAVARLAIIIGDTWQWTPFVFIILLAGLEGLPPETVEAALVDGANRAQMFRFIILPQIIPVTTTVILIRMIEAFKIIDMPQILTRGGPGTATESMTLHSYNLWRALDLGTSSALAYLLLFLVTFLALVFVNFVRQWLLEYA
jgi:multiple sugar transport system permease protein